MEVFKQLGIIDPILRVIEEEHFTEPSEIQEKAIPLVVQGKDVIAQSATGSGKTLAFGAGIIQHVEHGKGIQSLVMTPTRELAEQVCRALQKFSKYRPLKFVPVYGGVSINPQIDALQHADVVVGTPGRLLDHLERRTLRLDKVKILVLDEADRMFDMGFIDDVERIISQCSRERQTMLFSATFSEEIRRLVRKYMRDAQTVSAESQVDPSKLHQVYYDVPDNMKFSLLVHLLKKEHPGLVMVFCNTQQAVDFVTSNLKHVGGIKSLGMHGGFSQAKRNHALDMFHDSDIGVLVCTDVAARGLDIKGVSHVYNYDLPKDSKQYIHRIGRTARAGKEGIAINLLGSRDYDNFSRVLRDNSVDVKKLELPQFERVAFSTKPRFERDDRRGGQGGGGRGRFGGRSGGRSGGRGGSRGGYGGGEPPTRRFSW